MNQLSERLKNMTPLQRAVFALKETQARLDALELKRNEPIAIVGMACRFPGEANDPTSYWRLLCDGVDAIGDIPPDRWNADDFYDPNPSAPGKMCSRFGGFLKQIDEFDNRFFSISDGEAIRLDPQHRMLLELVWEALEDAGQPPLKLRGTKIGVFIGISMSEYGMMLSTDLALTNPYVSTGTSLCMAANRLSYAFGLQGPSLALDTACSSSLVAIHLACQAIRNGECEGALVGGSNLMLSPVGTINLTKAGFCAPNGRVRAFDAAAAGSVRSEGLGVVMLKPLSAAIKNKDPIYAVIRGSAVNQNGSCNGLSAPSRAAQEQVIREAYAKSRVSPGQVGFVETQGTGTRLGDIIEATALGNVLAQDRKPGHRCAIGALKTNLGHLEAASGIASLIKTALVLKNRLIPANLNFEKANPDIPFETLPLEVPRSLRPWNDSTEQKFAGVSAFGYGGSNVHVVLEGPPAVTNVASTTPQGDVPRLLPLSARTESALQASTRDYVTFLSNDPPNWIDVCYSASERRQHHDCRLVVLAGSQTEASDQLQRFLSGEPRVNVFAGRKPYDRDLKIVFLYCDSIEKWKACAPQLMESVTGFAEASRVMDIACQNIAGWSLTTIQKDDARWNDPVWARCACVALELALTAWWSRIGVTPDLVFGQGVCELAAATVAGIITPEEALRLALRDSKGGSGSRNETVNPRPASLPFLSAAYGRIHSGADLDPDHWRACLESGSEKATAISKLADRQIDLCLEIGPDSLDEATRQLLVQHCQKSVIVPSLQSTNGDGIDVMASTGALYVAGADIRWENLSPQLGQCVRIPTYPWQRTRFWALGENPFQGSPSHQSTDKEIGQSIETVEEISQTEVQMRPDLTAPYVEPRTKLEERMVQSWSEILRIKDIGIYDNFFELGGNSLQATILLNHLQELLGEAIPGHALFQVQCVNDLADYMRQHCTEAIRRNFPDELAALDSCSTDTDFAPFGLEVQTPSAVKIVSIGRPSAIPRLARDMDPEDLLARLDELEDDEVDQLLSAAMTDEVSNHE